MLVLNLLLLNREYALINVLKALALIISICNLHVFSQLNTCGHSPYITFSLMRGWVCHLQLLLAVASAFILGSEFCGTRDHILLSQIRDFPFCRLLQLAGLRWSFLTALPSLYILI
jgi:hypothetical protein